MSSGPPILFERALIRRMLDLAEANKDDIFYDLGCGYAENLIIASQEYNIRRCKGYELSARRAAEARRRVEKAGCSSRIKIRTEDLHKADLENATLVFFGLSASTKVTEMLVTQLKRGCRLIYYVNCPQPAILSDQKDYPFFVATAPLREARSELQWLQAHTSMKHSTVNDYWRELLNLSEEGKPYGFFGTDAKYGGVLKRVLRKRLSN